MSTAPALPHGCLFTNTVYSLVFPETEALMRSILTEETETLLARHQDAYLKTQDPMHETFMSAWLNFTRDALSWKPDEFKEHYPCNGSSEAIFHILAQSVSRKESIVVFDGDYEGYEMLARSVGNENVHFIQRSHWRESIEAWKSGQFADVENAQFWLSHPSAIDGNVWEDYDEFLEAVAPLVEQGKLRLFIDLTYVGRSLLKTPINLGHRSISAIVFSLSKVMGAYYRRIGGCMSREAIPSLWGNRWFKNIDSLYMGQRWLEEGNRNAIDEGSRYRSQQIEALRLALDSAGGHGVWNFVDEVWAPSDVTLLTYSPCPHRHLPETFQGLWNSATRGKLSVVSRRLCLTPALTQILRS